MNSENLKRSFSAAVSKVTGPVLAGTEPRDSLLGTIHKTRTFIFSAR